jgi:hypothetical protein
MPIGDFWQLLSFIFISFGIEMKFKFADEETNMRKKRILAAYQAGSSRGSVMIEASTPIEFFEEFRAEIGRRRSEALKKNKPFPNPEQIQLTGYMTEDGKPFVCV